MALIKSARLASLATPFQSVALVNLFGVSIFSYPPGLANLPETLYL